MSGAGEHTDILSVADVVRDRWKVVSLLKVNRKSFLHSHGLTAMSAPFIPGKEDRWRGLRGDLRGFGSVEPGHCCLKGGVCSTTQASAEDGGGRVEKASG